MSRVSLNGHGLWCVSHPTMPFHRDLPLSMPRLIVRSIVSHELPYFA